MQLLKEMTEIVTILDVFGSLDRREIATILYVARMLEGRRADIEGIYPSGVEWYQVNGLVDYMIDLGILESRFGEIRIADASDIPRDCYIAKVAKFFKRLDRRTWIDVAGYFYTLMTGGETANFRRTKKIVEDLIKEVKA